LGGVRAAGFIIARTAIIRYPKRSRTRTESLAQNPYRTALARRDKVGGMTGYAQRVQNHLGKARVNAFDPIRTVLAPSVLRWPVKEPPLVFRLNFSR
jgi:hypothetical protein